MTLHTATFFHQQHTKRLACYRHLKPSTSRHCRHLLRFHSLTSAYPFCRRMTKFHRIVLCKFFPSCERAHHGIFRTLPRSLKEVWKWCSVKHLPCETLPVMTSLRQGTLLFQSVFLSV